MNVTYKEKGTTDLGSSATCAIFYLCDPCSQASPHQVQFLRLFNRNNNKKKKKTNKYKPFLAGFS